MFGKVYSGLSGRRFSSDLQEAHVKGYISRLPHFNSIYNYFDKPELTPLLRELVTVTALPLKAVESDFAVDSTGISNNRFVKWFNVKHGKELDYSDWIKLHLMSGVVTNVVTSVEISGRHEHDTNFFKPLVDSTAYNFTMKEVSADKAYSSRDNLHAVVAHGATPFIPFKSNATGEAGGDNLWKIMFHYYSLKRSEFLQHYHKRSNIESTVSMIKGKFGDAIKGKTETAQVNEVLLKVLCHNICVVHQSMFELGIEATFCAGFRVAQKVRLFGDFLCKASTMEERTKNFTAEVESITLEELLASELVQKAPYEVLMPSDWPGAYTQPMTFAYIQPLNTVTAFYRCDPARRPKHRVRIFAAARGERGTTHSCRRVRAG